MSDPPDAERTIAPGSSLEAAILDRMVCDHLEGGLRDVGEYERDFPGCGARIRALRDYVEGAEPSDLEPSDELPESIDGFRIVRELARGGQGVVYLAEDPHLGRQVAVKLLTAWSAFRPEAVARLLREAELASRIEHPGVCTIYASGTERGLPFIVMRYVEGQSLKAWAASILRDTRRGRTQLVDVVERVARAVHAAHAQGIIHRDIKPGNIRVTPDGQPVLLDFGLARSLDVGGPALTRSDATVGTPAYMAPEQIERGAHALDARTDVFALCVTLFELLTGRRPFEGATVQQTYEAILRGDLPSPRRLSPIVDGDLEVILRTGLDRAPDRRYVDAQALADDLRRYLDHRPIAAKPASARIRVQRWFARHPALGVALTMIAIGLIGGLLLTLGFLREVTEERNRFDRKAQEYAHLAAGRALDELVAELTPAFWYPDPAREDELRDWLRRARELTSPLPTYRATLARMASESTPVAPGAARAAQDLLGPLEELRERRARVAALRSTAAATGEDWDAVRAALDRGIAELEATLAEKDDRAFAAHADAWHYEQLDALVTRLDAFASGDGLGVGIPDVEALLEASRVIEAETIVRPRDAWARAARAVSADVRFHGLALEPQLGLVPLGADPVSGLQEFGVFGTGALPARGEDGVLVETDDACVVLVLLPGGTAELGATRDDGFAVANELARTVELAPFFLGKYEVTQAQWERVLGTNPSAYSVAHASPPNPLTPRNPVESVHWYDSAGFATRLGLALPTEAQWEYACRAGTHTRFHWGRDAAELDGRENIGDQSVTIPGFEPAPWNDGFTVHAPVGTFEANAFGLYDMHGNVSEWTLDRYAPTPLAQATLEAGDGLDLSATRSERTFRGGSWYASPRFSRCSVRSHMDPSQATAANGLRLAARLR